jgi:hypothetical protein
MFIDEEYYESQKLEEKWNHWLFNREILKAWS